MSDDVPAPRPGNDEVVWRPLDETPVVPETPTGLECRVVGGIDEKDVRCLVELNSPDISALAASEIPVIEGLTWQSLKCCTRMGRSRRWASDSARRRAGERTTGG